MKLRLLAAALFLLGIVCISQQPRAQLTTTGVGGGGFGGGCSATLSLDGSGQGHVAGNTAVTISLTTTLTNDVLIIVMNVHTNVNGTPIVSSSPSLTWTAIPSYAFNNIATQGQTYFGYYAISAGTFSGTVTMDSSAFANGTFQTGYAIGINGANTSSPFDGTPGNSTTSFAAMTTTFANDFLFGLGASASVPPTAVSPWIDIGTPGNFTPMLYQIVSSTGTYTLNWTSGAPQGSVIAAVQRSC